MLHRRPLEAVVRHRGTPLARCLIRRGRYVIGQARRNEIVIDDDSVSGIHARLAVVSEEEIYIEDLGSANGTLVNGQPASGNTRVTFDCKVQIGATTLEFQRGGLPASVFRFLPEGFLRPRRYDCAGAIVQGSTSTIHEARDTSLNREVARKVMLPSSQATAAHVLRFIREAQVTSQLQHPGILPIYDLGLDEQGLLYYTTRFIEGESLAAILDRIAAGDAATIARHRFASLLTIFQKACDAVAFAHSRGVVHGHLQPLHITVGSHGEVFVGDWGLAKILPPADGSMRPLHATETESIPPLSRYTSPESAGGAPGDIGPHTDIHGLGGVLYRIVSLRDPLDAESESGIREQALHARNAPPRTACPHWPCQQHPDFLAAVAMRALHLAPGQRHESVAALQHEVAAWQEGTATVAEHRNLWKEFAGLVRQ